MRKSTTYTVGAVALTLVLAPGLAAQAKTATYNVHHDLVIKPNAGFGGEWQAGWRYGVGRVFAREGKVSSAPKNLSGQIEPFSGAGSPKELSATAGASFAKGLSGATASGGPGSAPFMGSVTASGIATVNPPKGVSAQAAAASSSLLVAGLKRTSSSGHITWNSVSSVSVSGGKSVGVDPIDVTVFDPITFKSIEERLLEIDLAIDGGTGAMTWAGGFLTMASDDLFSGAFTINRSGHFTTNPGMLSLKFLNNVITESIGTGIYAGLAPSVGASALGSFAFGEPDIDYDFGFGDRPISVDFGFANGGHAGVAEVPEPGVWALLIAGLAIVGGRLRRRRVALA